MTARRRKRSSWPRPCVIADLHSYDTRCYEHQARPDLACGSPVPAAACGSPTDSCWSAWPGFVSGGCATTCSPRTTPTPSATTCPSARTSPISTRPTKPRTPAVPWPNWSSGSPAEHGPLGAPPGLRAADVGALPGPGGAGGSGPAAGVQRCRAEGVRIKAAESTYEPALGLFRASRARRLGVVQDLRELLARGVEPPATARILGLFGKEPAAAADGRRGASRQ